MKHFDILLVASMLAACSSSTATPAPTQLPQPINTIAPVTRTPTKTPTQLTGDLRQATLDRLAKDQAAREDEANYPGDATYVAKTKLVDADNTNWLKQTIAAHGYPGSKLLGEDGAQAAFTLILHADDVAFQKQCYALMEEPIHNGEAKIQWRAFLRDRILVAEGKNQLYGTQVKEIKGGKVTLYPIDDEANVDQRRQTFGLEPLAEYVKKLSGVP
jgi:hypothetical protein